MSLNLNDYKNAGIGLSKDAFETLENNIVELYNSKDFSETPLRVVEFGSGFSTKFLVDLKKEYDLNMTIESYDNSSLYCYKNTDGDEFVDVRVRNLLHCSEEDYKQMFESKEYDSDKMDNYDQEPSYRQKNCFYNLNEDDIQGKYDVMVVDGPNGNGRNFAFLHFKDNMNSGGLIFIDDIDHYDFEETMNHFFDTTEKVRVLEDDRNDKWNNGGRIGLFKIK